MAGSLPSRRFRYMTARCPQGCGWWSIPAAVGSHVRAGRCTGVPWPLAVPPSVLIPAGSRTALVAALPGAVKRPPVFGDRVTAPLMRDRRLSRRALAGVLVVSPVPEVGARRWLETVAAAVETLGTGVIDQALTAEGFAGLEETVGLPSGLVACGVCGEWVADRAAECHRARNSRCRWLAAHRAVEDAWADGWRDPGSQRPDVPTRWDELRHGRWRRFLRLVEYPQWTAVLVDPAQRLRPEVPVVASPVGQRR